MPQNNPMTHDRKKTQKELVSTIEGKLAGSADEELFYTASLRFLNKRLHQKTQLPLKPHLTSQSCCQFNQVEGISKSATSSPASSETHIRLDLAQPEGPSLSLHQLLPFPKSQKVSFVNRLKKIFRKYPRSADISETNNAYDAESSKVISNFKFPRFVRRTKDLHPSCLVKISEESANEKTKTPDINDAISQGDVLSYTDLEDEGLYVK